VMRPPHFKKVASKTPIQYKLTKKNSALYGMYLWRY